MSAYFEGELLRRGRPPMISRNLVNLRTFLRPSQLLASAAVEDKSKIGSTLPPGMAMYHPKIDSLVDEISGLTLLQAADLVTALKSRLNIQEIASPVSAAPVATAPVEAEEAPVEEKPKEKTVFNVKLESFDSAAKPKIIREIKTIIPNITLLEAKKFVESVPQIIKENISKEDAEKLKTTLEKLGGKVVLE